MEPIETYLPMVQVVIAKMRSKGWPIRNRDVDDLAQEGAIALVQAYRTFDPSRPEPIEARLAKSIRQGVAQAFLSIRSAETGISIKQLRRAILKRTEMPKSRRVPYEELFTNRGEALV